MLMHALVTYIRDLSHSDWDAARAETQFLGHNMSHELGALLLTETISHSIHDDNRPLFCLFLDARSAFDLTVRELIIRKLFLSGTTGHRLVYLDNRLKHRKTFIAWDRGVLGPINDQVGFEQGGNRPVTSIFFTIMSSLTPPKDQGLESASLIMKSLQLDRLTMSFFSPRISSSSKTSSSSLKTTAESFT